MNTLDHKAIINYIKSSPLVILTPLFINDNIYAIRNRNFLCNIAEVQKIWKKEQPQPVAHP